MLRNVNQITDYETNEVSFLLSKCEPPVGLLCSAEGTELPAVYGLAGWSPTKSNKTCRSLETRSLHNEQESWDHVTELREDRGEGFLGIVLQSGVCSTAAMGACGKDSTRSSGEKVYPRFFCLLPHWAPSMPCRARLGGSCKGPRGEAGGCAGSSVQGGDAGSRLGR